MGWPKNLFAVFHNILWKAPNERFGQPMHLVSLRGLPAVATWTEGCLQQQWSGLGRGTLSP